MPTDIEQICNLKGRYFFHMDAKQWSEWQMVFTADAVLDIRGEYPEAPDPALYLLSGRAAIGDFVSDVLTEIVTVHHGHTPLITVHEPDTASGIWAMEDNLFMADGSRMTGYGHYHEDYRCIDGTWFIARTKLTRLRIVWH